MSDHTAEFDQLREERDMYRDKAHRAIGSTGRWEAIYARLWVEHQSLVDALGDLTEAAEQRAIMTVGASELRFLSEGHYREDGPNGETTSCHCGIGRDHDLAEMDALYDEDGERVTPTGKENE
jgi:hypothetical protein